MHERVRVENEAAAMLSLLRCCSACKHQSLLSERKTEVLIVGDERACWLIKFTKMSFPFTNERNVKYAVSWWWPN